MDLQYLKVEVIEYNLPDCSTKNVFFKKIININLLHLPIRPFHSAKLLKNYLIQSKILGPKIAQFVQNKTFLVKTIIITFIYLLALFIGQKF